MKRPPTAGFLKCQVKEVGEGEAEILSELADGESISGLVAAENLSPYLKDPRYSLLKVEILAIGRKKVLIQWPVKCTGDMCPGDSLWISKEFLIETA